jgi:hypothetical protein
MNFKTHMLGYGYHRQCIGISPQQGEVHTAKVLEPSPVTVGLKTRIIRGTFLWFGIVDALRKFKGHKVLERIEE